MADTGTAAVQDSGSFWINLLKAAESEPSSARVIRGASGINHDIIALGVDESRRRLLIVSGEHDARTAAMVQADIQAAMGRTQVLVARPIALDFTPLARALISSVGTTTVTLEDLKAHKVRVAADPGFANKWVLEHGAELTKGLEFAHKIPLNSLAQWMLALQQLAYIDFNFDSDFKSGVLDFRRLAELNPLEYDNHYGLCPVPLYEFDSNEIELLNSQANSDDVRDILSRRSVLQYFFPSPDMLAIGLVDRGSNSTAALVKQLVLSPKVGHPFGAFEVVNQDLDLPGMIQSLQDQELLVEGELGLELGPAGKTIRQIVKFRPREGFISKLIRRFSIKVDIKSIIGK